MLPYQKPVLLLPSKRLVVVMEYRPRTVTIHLGLPLPPQDPARLNKLLLSLSELRDKLLQRPLLATRSARRVLLSKALRLQLETRMGRLGLLRRPTKAFRDPKMAVIKLKALSNRLAHLLSRTLHHLVFQHL
jgi:hypothetical protein